jgi:hypothetical protein
MKVVLWFLLLVPNFVAILIAWSLAPLLALLVDDGGRLPPALRMFETADNPAFGDRDHERRWAGWPHYVRFVAWFWRNPAYGFSNEIIGARTSGPVHVLGNHTVSDRPRLIEGWCLRRTPEGYWHFYVVRRWGLGFCLRLNVGWKLAGEPGGPNFGQYVCHVHPFLRRSRAPVIDGVTAPERAYAVDRGKSGRPSP